MDRIHSKEEVVKKIQAKYPDFNSGNLTLEQYKNIFISVCLKDELEVFEAILYVLDKSVVKQVFFEDKDSQILAAMHGKREITDRLMAFWHPRMTDNIPPLAGGDPIPQELIKEFDLNAPVNLETNSQSRKSSFIEKVNAEKSAPKDKGL